jgi:hypothetical protein
VTAPPGSFWQAGEAIGVCLEGGAERKLYASADAGGTTQTPPPCTATAKGDAPDQLCSESVSRCSPVIKVRALSANSCHAAKSLIAVARMHH